MLTNKEKMRLFHEFTQLIQNGVGNELAEVKGALNSLGERVTKLESAKTTTKRASAEKAEA